MRVYWCLVALCSALPHLALAQEPAAVTAVKCAFQQEEQPRYILWLCNPEGTATSQEGSVLWVRTNAAGAEVMTTVWHGSSEELLSRSTAIIDRHQRAHHGCRHFVHIARANGGRLIAWNTAPRAALSALKAVAAPATTLCYAQEPGSADYVVLWASDINRLPNAFTVSIPASADSTAPAPLTPGVPKLEPSSGLRVALGVYRVDPGMDNSILRLGLSVFSASNTGRPGSPRPFNAAFAYLNRALGNTLSPTPTTRVVP